MLRPTTVVLPWYQHYRSICAPNSIGFPSAMWQSAVEPWLRAEVWSDYQPFQPRPPCPQADFLPSAFAVHAWLHLAPLSESSRHLEYAQ
ncbi:hypothetical protein [Brunnivagina elsteri]|uniref:hypothetical protein n=1 Tax=Brunnivagina elsteri TaxID=1247191 RepID=UPI001B80415B|nr:hypothetical protein [Calothrix elsteri]